MNSSQKFLAVLMVLTIIALSIRSVTAILPILPSTAFNCSFDQDLCGWTQAQDDDFDWERRSVAEDNDVDSGLAHNHNGDGYYMFANSKDYTVNQKARLVSPFLNITSNQQKCLQFFYLMHGAQVGTLTVYLSPDGTPNGPVWSRIGTQGIYYRLGQVTLLQSGFVIIEGSGSSGSEVDIAFDDVGLIDGACISLANHNSYNSLACDFELDLCGYVNALGNNNGWHRAKAASLMMEDTFDHTTRTATGAFLTIDIGNNVNKQVSLMSENMTSQGSYCVSFFYREEGINVGLLSVSVRDYSNNVITQLWQDRGTAVAYQWTKAQFSLNITSVIQLSFDATMTAGGDGDMSLDDINVLPGACETPPDCSFDKYDLCSWINDYIHDDFDWEIATFHSDANIFAPYRDADNNVNGGFILLDMASNPSKKEAFLVSEVIRPGGTQCFNFYYYPMIKSAQFEQTPMLLNIYVSTDGDFPGTLYWTYAVTKQSTFVLGKLPLQMNSTYRIVIGGSVTLGQVISMDKFSLVTTNCSYLPAEAKPPASVVKSTTTATTNQPQLSSSTRPHSLWDCDFEPGLCHWKSNQTANSTWTRRQPGFYLNGPRFDHTTGPGGHGYFLSLDTATGKLQTDTALKAKTNYCLVFWFYLYGSTAFEFTVQTMDTSPTTLMTKQDSMGTVWHQMTLNLPVYSTPFNILFVYEQKISGISNRLDLDDIQVYEGNCSLEVGPNCTFERGFCNWGNSKDNDFNFTMSSGSSQASGGIQSDHTTETDLGSFVKATTNGHPEGQKAHFQSPKLTFNGSVCMRYYYIALCDTDLGIETLGPQDRHSVPLADMQDILYGAWQLGEVTIYDPQDTQVIFTVTVRQMFQSQNRSCEVGFDDVEFIDGDCPYKGATDFENGFDVFHNVYSNDFNWVIASPSDGIYTWLPPNDFSTNTPNGHLAVATFTYSLATGKKAELWGPLSPPVDFYCTSFYLYVRGNDPGILNVTLVDFLDDTRVVVWSYTPPPINRAAQIYAQFPHVYPRQFFVVFTVILGSDGDWAIDSIDTFPSVTCRVIPILAAASTVAPPTIPPPQTTAAFSHQSYGECDFETNLCNWVIPDYSDVNWTRTSGDPDLQFSPQQGRPGGKKFFLTLPKFSPGKTAILQSPSFNEQSPGSDTLGKFSFRLWLNMNGDHIGRFRVDVNSVTLGQTVYYRDTATNSWEQIEFSVDISGPFSLTIEGERNSYELDSISIDDIEVSYTSDMDDDNVYKCTFESSDLCGFKQDSSDNMDWMWMGNQPDLLLQDHTYMTSVGHAVLVNHTQGKPGDIARLISKTVPPMSGCLTFWLLMTSDGAALRVYVDSVRQEELILQKRNIQGYVWVKSETPISSNGPFYITLEAEVLAERSTDLVIDDFQLSSEACDTQGACTFERDMCTWQNSLISGADFDWIKGTGNTVGVKGPAVDSTTASADGYYMYIDSSGPYQYQDKAWLDSETFPRGVQCLHFHYYMSGASIGTLNVYTLELDSQKFMMTWSLSGDQGRDWNSAMVTVGTTLVNYYVRFEGTLGFSVISNIAIDDIIFMPGACNTQPPEANAFSQISTTPTTATNQSSQIIIQRCDFDDALLCGFKNGTSDNFWVAAGPNMSVSDTLKPFNGHTSNRTNSFIYAQVGNGTKENSTARFISPSFDALNGEPKCLEFYYHMNGDQVGWLKVYIAPDGQENSLTNDMCLWSQNFDAGPGWKKGLVPIYQPTNYHVVFEAVRSKVDYYYGIDDLTIFDHECEPSESCDFEEDYCLWSNEGGEIDSHFYWKRYRGRERTAPFAPTIDHTSQTVDGYYMFVESSLAAAGSVARLYSQVLNGFNGPYCFHFWYYMFGSKLGQLKVFVRNSISSSSYFSDAELWQLNDPAGDGWFLALVNISHAYTKKPFMVIIEATVGSTLEGAFGVDDTQFEAAECGTQPSAAIITANAQMLPDCDFEDGDMCDWLSVGFSMYRFTVANTGAAIPFDHSGGAGKFLFADSKKLPQNTYVILQSPLLPPTFGTSCLTLWYNMQESGLSTLALSLVTVGNELNLWTVSSEGASNWLSVRVNIQNNFDYKLLIMATVGTSDAGSVAVDDITLTHGACRRSGMITFEEGLSGFTPTALTNINWVLKLASDSFELLDHTFQTSVGHILEADLGNGTTNLKTAEIQSPLYPSVGDECMEFWYAKKGTSGGWFSVRISENGPGFVADDSNPLWLTTADTHGVWKRALLDISSEYPYWIIFQAAANNNLVSDVIIIDDVSFRPDPCPSAVTCDFELNNCDYTIPTSAVFFWRAVKGAYSDSLMPFDQTLQSDQGMYIEVDFPNTLSTITADLISPVEQQISSKCLIFWYSGSGAGTLQVFAQTSPNQRQSLVTKTISADVIEARPYRSWKKVQVDVSSSAPYSIVFEAINQQPDTSFAIDAIQLMNGTCASLTQIPDRNPSTSSLLDPKTAMLGCDFEKSDFCNFTSGNSRTFSWKIFSFNSSHSTGTGVDFDHTKNNKYGHHVFMDASGHKFNTTALLVSPSFVNDKFVCLSFYYAMFGRDVNRLNVYIAQGQTKTLFWTQSDNQGEVWHHQMVEIGAVPEATQVIFEGLVGRSDESDIDLDDIWIFGGRCPPPEYCDFEDSEICKMDQDNLDDADWVIRHALLATGSEPKIDHTYGTDKGSYLLLDMSGTTSNQVARIFTRQYNADSARCLTFWYHFTNPATISHTLNVSLQDERGIGTILIILRGLFKEVWTQAMFPLEPTENFQIVFEGQSSGSEGNIALDDIMVSPNECESYIDCDFESHDMCGWELVPKYSTPPWEVIPPNHYMTLNFSKVYNSTVQFSQVQSQIIPPGMSRQFCFTFDYMMYGANVGYLNISVEVEYPEPTSIVIFSIYGDQGRDTWRYAYGNNPQTDLGISRFVITGSTTETSSNNTQTSLILMSNILVVFQPCSEWVTQKEAFFGCSVDKQIPVSSLCDFIDDCIGRVDEEICGACDFEKDYCNWEDDSTGALKFTSMGATPNMVFTDPHPGIFMTVQRSDGIPGVPADLVLNQELGPSPYNCSMVFSYYMSPESQAIYGNLYVSVEENNDETVVWESSQGNITTWQTASVDIGSIKSRFKIHFASKYLPFDNAVGIDDIRFTGCSYAENYGPCATQFKCRRTGACIDNSTKFCDFTDECGDSTDEDPAICGDFLMDDFEDSFGDWSQDDHDDFDWSRHSGRWISSSSGPRRDHTLGTHFGHYLIFEGGTHTDGQVAWLISPEFLPTKNNDCKIRFYYHMHGSDQGQLTLYIKSKTTDKVLLLGQYFTKLNDAWLFSSSDLTSTDNFQVIFEGKVVGQHSTDIGLDDITFTPQCELKYPSPHRPGTSTTVTTAKSSSFTTRQSPATAKASISAQTGGSSTSKPAPSVSTEKPQITEGISAGASSDSWKVPVGVVLGLLGLVAVTAGVIIYLKRMRTLKWMMFPFFRKDIKTTGGERNPVFDYDATGDTTIQMSEQKPVSGSVSEIFGESTEQAVMSDTYVGVSNPLYTEA